MSGRLLRRAPVVLIVVLVVVQAAAIILPPRFVVVAVLRDVVPFVVPLVAAAFCFVAGNPRRPGAEPFWLFLGLGALCWGLGDIGYSIYGLLDIEPAGRLTLADAGYLLLIPLWGAALITHPSRSRHALDRFGTLIDALVVVAISATVTTVFVLEPALRGVSDLSGALVNTAYPLGDLALIVVLVTVLARANVRLRPAELLVGCAAATFAIGDSFYARLAISDQYYPGHVVDITWTLAFAFVALAAGHRLSSRRDVDERGSTFPTLAILGIVGMLGLAGLAALTRLRDPVVLTGGVITGLLVVSRLVVLLVDRARLVRSLDEKVGELKEAHAAREQFIATVSHDLRTPLSSITGFAELLRQPDVLKDPTQVAQITGSIERNARRLTRLTEDLLCAGQFATGHPPPLTFSTVDLRQTAQEVIEDMGLSGEVMVEGSPQINAIADRHRLQQVLTNLIDNAFKHSGSKDVLIRVGSSDDGPTIEVTDKGTGIPAEFVSKIFEPFESDFSRASNVGLGLYVVSSLVGAMNGRISVTSERGRGTTFTVVLPPAVSQATSEMGRGLSA
jgi:signal transduction histidine kinase